MSRILERGFWFSLIAQLLYPIHIRKPVSQHDSVTCVPYNVVIHIILRTSVTNFTYIGYHSHSVWVSELVLCRLPTFTHIFWTLLGNGRLLLLFHIYNLNLYNHQPVDPLILTITHRLSGRNVSALGDGTFLWGPSTGMENFVIPYCKGCYWQHIKI